ncbi:hypothetical protein [Reyranella soli]|jgi:hypothetical protein|uniref:DUF1453 domain-containing protein n=1 Tax=Reyranella soli TaxID=1230389 RepID=A0A512NT72_9HYPH|nr:hypothetical protein [Reyranella soli]GEP62150.1 hypothetical protein RSO01_93160 [Reyranella soli]
MISPLSLSNVLTLIFAVTCLTMVLNQRSDRVQRISRLVVPPALAVVVALILLTGVFESGLATDALWVGGAIVGFVLGRLRGRMLPMELLPAPGSVRVAQTADHLAAAFALVAVAATDFTSATLREPVLEPALVAAGGALCAGFLAGRFLMIAVRADPVARLKKGAR